MSDHDVTGTPLSILDPEARARVRVATFDGHSPVRLRAASGFPGQRPRELAFSAIRQRAKDGDQGGDWFSGLVRELVDLRHEAHLAARHGERPSREAREAGGLSFAAIADMPGLVRAFDFPVTYREPVWPDGRQRATVTTSALALLTSTMALADVDQGYEGVPTIVEELVTELDDNHANTEIGAALDFGHAIGAEEPKPLKETEAYRDVGAGEDRFTAITFRDGYKRSFSQVSIERMPGRVFAELSDLGAGAREVMERFGIGLLMDYWGSRGTNPRFHVLNLNRAAVSLYTTTANSPGTRAPSGTRINNNRLDDATDLSALRTRLVAMRNSRNMPIMNWPEVIVVPDAAWERAWAALESENTPGVFNEVNFYGPRGPRRTQLISSPMIDLFTTTTWWGGRPKRQFVRKWAQRPEVSVHGGADTAAYTETRQGLLVRIGWDMLVFARDYVYMVECLDATTPPGGA